jgi:2-polyprenyl-3-methyl-5-hydroxy-6-metoxy-1,4-benzoquinol methylase
MSVPTLCILIPTVGRASLGRLLASVSEQDLGPRDEVLLVSDDGHEAVAATWSVAGLPGRHLPLPGGPHRDWGHTPRNLALPQVRADAVLHADDDDILLPGAVARIRAALAAHPGDLHIFPFVRHRDRHFVGSDGVLAHGYVGTPNLVHPAGIPLGRWEPVHGGDGAFITATAALHPDRTVHWHGEPHYYAGLPPEWDLAQGYAAGFQLARSRQPGFRLIPAKPAWTDLATAGGGVGREDCQVGWHALAAERVRGLDILDVGAGLGFSRERLARTARRVRLQDPGPGLGTDLSTPVEDLASGEAEAVTAFDVLEHVEDDRGFVEHLLRLATRAVFLTTPNWRVSRAANRHHCREYTPAQLLALLDGLPVTGLWAGDPTGQHPRLLERAEFLQHTEPHQAVLLEPLTD